MIPLFHDFTGGRVVVVGAGEVALRKARRFAREAEVTVIGPEVHPDFADVDCTVERRHLDPDDAESVVEDATLVVAATGDEALDDALATAAQEAGCLCNHAGGDGDVVVPSTIQTDELTVAISTHGASPAVSKLLRQDLTPHVERVDSMVPIQRSLRRELKRAVDDPDRRRELLWRVLEADEVWNRLPDDPQRARERARELAELADSDPISGASD